jgi:RimJ/RimL family protein N-acetyltransferase
MKYARVIGDLVYLRAFEREDLTDEYLEWVNNTSVIAHIVTTGFPVNRDKLTEFYEANQADNCVLFAVCDKETGTHIGNARLSNIDWIHRSAVYGRLMGHPDFRGKGYGTDALIQLLRFGFHNLGINRIWSAAADANAASLRSNEKVGMTIEGTMRQAVYLKGRFRDAITLSMLREDFDRIHGTPEKWAERGTA